MKNDFIDVHSEAVCIGACLTGDPDLVLDVLSTVSYEDFGSDEARAIIQSIEVLKSQDKQVTVTELKTELEKTGWFDRIDGLRGLAKYRMVKNEDGLIRLRDDDATAFSSAGAAANRVKELARRRKLFNQGSQVLAQHELTSRQMAEALMEIAMEAETGSGNETKSELEEAHLLYEHIDRLEKGHLIGYPTGYDIYDAATGGLMSDYLLIIGLEKGAKSILGLSIVDNLVQRKIPSAIFSLEMPRLNVRLRRLARRSNGLLHRRLRGGIGITFTPEEAELARLTIEEISTEPLYIIDQMFLTPEMMLEAERLIRNCGVRVLLFDYAQLFEDEGTETETLRKASRNIVKLINKYSHLNVSAIVLSQMDKEGIQMARAIGDINTGNTHGSSALKKDATVVTKVQIEDQMYLCGCEEQTVTRPVRVGRQTVQVTERKHKAKPPDGRCKECGKYVTMIEARQGAWTIDTGRASVGGVSIPLSFYGDQMMLAERKIEN